MTRCSFCAEVGAPGRRLLSGPDGIAICADCAELAVSVLAEPEAPEPDVLLTSIGSLVTMDGRHGGLLGVLHGVVVAIRRGRIVWIGPPAELPDPYTELAVMDCGGRVVVPGFVDPTVRVVGSTSDVRPDPLELADRGASALRAMQARGVTCVGVAVGGSPVPTAETLRMAVGRSLDDRMAMRVVVTWCLDPDIPASETARVMVPTASRLVDSVAVTCRGDASEFEAAVAATRPLPYRVTCLEPESAACLPFVSGARSVSGVTPGAAGPAGPPCIVPWWEPGLVRNHWAGGDRTAIATFSDPEERLLSGMGVALMAAVDLAGVSFDRALWSVTRGGAMALGDGERGWVHLGGPADLVVLDSDDPGDLVRRPDSDLAWSVFVAGLEVTR